MKNREEREASEGFRMKMEIQHSCFYLREERLQTNVVFPGLWLERLLK